MNQPARKVEPRHPHIVSLKSHCGGRPIILGTKFPVRSVVCYVLRQGITPEELVREFPNISLSQIYAALSYYYENKEEIDQDLATRAEDLRDGVSVD